MSNIRFEEWEVEKLQDAEFRAAAEELEPAYQIARLRIMRGLTQNELARRVGTKQSSIARLESGKTEPRLSFLRRVVAALQGKLEVRITPNEQEPPARQLVKLVVLPYYIGQGNYVAKRPEPVGVCPPFTDKNTNAPPPDYYTMRKR